MPLLGEDDIFDDLPVDQHSCKLLGPTALVVQGLMGLLVISSLVYKRHRESPKRPWRIWSFDVSKQIIGQMYVHGVNVLISGVVAHLSSGNACVLYFLNILIDTTLGVAIIYLTLHTMAFVLTEKLGFKGFESGKYGTPPSFGHWFRQLSVYIFALTTMKALVVALFALWPGIFKLGEWLLSFLGTSEAAQVIFTMGIFPIIMNILQFWLIDSIVKASAHSASVALPSDSLDPDQEPLFRASSDDEDDDSRPHDIENPVAHTRSRSISKDRRRSLSPDEHKSVAASSATASGSITPKAIDIERDAVAMHAYPPSLVGSSISTISSRSPSTRRDSMSPQPKRSRRSPPPPLSFHPRSPQPMALNGGQRSTPAPPRSPPEPIDEDEDAKDWASWGDEHEEDWANRVGEEDWTGRRIGERKAAVDNVWSEHTSTTPSGRISAR